MADLSQLLNAPAPFEAGGVVIPMRRVSVADWQAMLEAFAGFARAIAAVKPEGYRITEADVEQEMPAALLDAWTLMDRADVRGLVQAMASEPAEGEDPPAVEARRAQAGWVGEAARAARGGVLEFVRYFAEATEEQLDTLDVDGWHALWGRIWAANRVPFVRRLQQLLMAGEMEPMALRASLQPTSTPAASIPETEGSASSTPSPSPTDTPPANSRPARRRRS